MTRLDSDLLRTFLAVCEAGSVSGGAGVIGRSQSAASLQIKQLEGIVGRPLFRRHGRGIALTAAGERLVPTARKVTASLDTALAELRDDGLSGRLRVGIPDDESGAVLSRIIADFAARHPDVELDVHCTLGTGFERALQNGSLDLAVLGIASPAEGDEVLRRDEVRWMANPERDLHACEILPVALFDRDCWWRDVAMADLEASGRRYRVVFTSESTAGVLSAVQSGIAAGLLDTRAAATALAPLPGMDARHKSFLVLRGAPGSAGPACDAMRDAIRNAFGLAHKRLR